MSELPHGWAWSTLQTACAVVRGITFPATAKEPKPTDANVCCLRTSNIQKQINWKDVYYVDRRYVKREDQFVQPGDVLMSMANSYELVGKVAKVLHVPSPTAFGAFLSAVRPTPAVNGNYLFHFLRTDQVQSELREGSSQTTNIANISVGRLSSIAMPLAPAAEQTRIANQLDTLLTRVQACNDRFDAIPALLKRFRQTVLVTAHAGGLTEDWRVDHGHELVVVTTLGSVLKVSSGNFLPAKDMAPNGEIPVFGGNGINGYHDHGNVQEKTLVIGRVGFYCGSIHLTPNSAWVTDNALIVRHDPSQTNREYLHYALKAVDLRVNDSSTAQPVISGQKIYPLPLRVPSVAEQLEIVRRIDALFALADRIEARCTAARTHAQRLTPLVLAKAFRGELVPQDPNDEPASALLARLSSLHGDTATSVKTRQPRKPRAAAAIKESTTMTKSRQDDDVKGKPYLSDHLRRIGIPITAEALFKVAELPIADFYKQLAWEADQGFVKDNKDWLELGDAA